MSSTRTSAARLAGRSPAWIPAIVLLGFAFGCAVTVPGVDTSLIPGAREPRSREMTLISNQANTVFLGRRIGGHPGAFVMGLQEVGAKDDEQGFVLLGRGKFATVRLHTEGVYEIVARPPGYRERTATIAPPLTSRLGFTFEISDRLDRAEGSLDDDWDDEDRRHASARRRERPDRSARSARTYKPNYERRVGAVIGINRYSAWPGLEGATGDARRMAAQLRAMGFDEVIELYDERATRSGILRLLGEELPRRTGPEDLAFIFFAGHGQTETLPSGEKRGYIIPVDGPVDGVFSSAISMQTLRDLSNRLQAKHVYYAMDSCYSGLGFTRGIRLADRSSPDYMAKITSHPAVQMITAGMEGEQAIERGGQGLFTSYLLRALRGEADRDGDGLVTAGEIGTFVRPGVTRASGQRQTPLYGTLDGSGEVAFLVR